MKAESASRDSILLVGRRKGALAAARRLGLPPVVLDLHSRLEQTPHAFGGSARWAVSQAEELFPHDPPRAVVAVATGASLAAAEIRSHFGLPGITPEIALRCHDKLVMKKAATAAGIPCARARETDIASTASALIAELGLPLVLKMPISSGGRGVWICRNASEVASHLRPGLLAEAFVAGTEMSVETMRAAGRTIFRNQSSYLKPRWANVVPADLAPPQARLVDQLAEQVHEKFGIQDGITHMELFIGEDGAVFGEIAARPPGGYLMELIARAYCFDPWELLLRLAIAPGETPPVPAHHSRFAGVWLIHPGAGTVREIVGLADAHAVPGVVNVSCRLAPGDVVGVRIGSGDNEGRILAEGETHQQCAHALTRAAETLRIALTSACSQEDP